MKSTNERTDIQLNNFKLDASKMIIVDLYSGKYNNTNIGHELYNLNKNPFDNNFYGYCPPLDGVVLKHFGAKSTDDFVEGVLVVYVKKKTNSSNREIIAFCTNSTVFNQPQNNNNLCRYFLDKDGIEKSASYSIVSDNLIDLSSKINKFEIKISQYSNSMFRVQRVYGGKYPLLDQLIITYLENIISNMNLLDNDDDQDEIQNSDPANSDEILNSSKKPLSIVNSSQGKIIAKDSKISKSALKESNYLCEVNHNHKTFITKRNVPYMEGHHLIPCTVGNSEYFMEKYNKNIDCFENIVSLCPNCHREIHYGEWTTKSIKLKILFDKYRFKLHNIGVIITENELLRLYKHD
jgi:hypothetical protein